MRLFFLLTLLSFVSCGTIKEMMKKGEVHQKMATKLDDNLYDIKLADLKAKLITSFANDHESPTIVMPMEMSPNMGSMEQQHNARQAVEDALDDEGFMYNKKMYKNELDLDFMGLFQNREKELEKVKANLKTGPYHVVQEDAKSFTLVKGINVYKAEAVGDKSKLVVTQIKKLERDPMLLKIDWLSSIKRGGLWFSISEGPISLERSMKYNVRDKMTELSLLHFLDPQKFASWEQESSL